MYYYYVQSWAKYDKKKIRVFWIKQAVSEISGNHELRLILQT